MTTFTTEELHDLRDRIKDVKFGMFTTQDAGGSLSSRPLTLCAQSMRAGQRLLPPGWCRALTPNITWGCDGMTGIRFA